MIEKNFTVISDSGIDAKNAAKLVQEANQYVADIDLEYKGKKINLKSIMGLMSFGIPKDAEIKIVISGKDEEEAVFGIEASLKNEGLAEIA